MPRVIPFVLRQLWASLRGDKLTHALTLSTVALSLMLVGGVVLVQRNLVTWADVWAADRAVVVFVVKDASETARRDLERDMGRDHGLTGMHWRSPRDTARELQSVLGIASAAGLEEFSPWVLEGERGDAPLDATAIRKRREVLHVDEGTVLAERVRDIARATRLGGTALALLLLLGAYLVVSNTVGLALNARRDEIDIMDLVGTPLLWIHSAYISEGAVLGLLGALLATAALELPLHVGVATLVRDMGLPPLMGIGGGAMLTLIGLGVGIGAIASFSSVRRFLNRRGE